jgi:PAS domain S-box-containing protein
MNEAEHLKFRNQAADKVLANAKEAAAKVLVDANKEAARVLAAAAKAAEELKRTETTRYENIERYTAIIKTAMDGFVLLDMRGHILQVNETYCLMLGYSQQELLAMSISDLEAAETAKDTAVHIQKVIAQGADRFESQQRHKDGTILDVEVTVQYRDIAGGQLVAFIRDITDRKKAGLLLRESEELLRESQDIANLGSYVLNITGGFWRSSEVMDRVFGIDQAYERSVEGWINLVHPDDRSMMQDYFQNEVLGKGKSFDKEYRIVRQNDQATRWVHGTGKVEYDAQKRPLKMLGTIQDITERKKAELYRETGREVLQTLNESVDVKESIHRAIDVLKARTGFDAVGIRLKHNDDFPYFDQNGFSADFLLTENTLAERDVSGCVCRDKDGNIALECTCGLVLSGKTDPTLPFFTPGGSFWTNNSFPLLEIPPDAEPRHNPRNLCIHEGYATVVLVPIRNKKGIVGLLQLNRRQKGSLTLDIVEIIEGIAANIGTAIVRMEMEEERNQLEIQLRQASKMEAVGQLAGGVAHDFNNMLGVILGHAELAIEQIDSSVPIYDDLEEIVKAAQRSADLTRQLLTFARKQVIAPQAIDVNMILEGSAKMLRRLTGENVSYILKPAANLWKIRMDPSQLEHVLANMCVNARDSIAGVGNIVIETGNCTFDKDYCSHHPHFLPGEFVRISVSDNGCGMDQKTLSRIFEPFYTTKEVGKGTGLGLAMVYGALQQNKGFINVESRPGQGSTFELYLPRHTGEDGQDNAKVVANPSFPSSKTILLVEDEAGLLKLIKAMLEQQGHIVFAAGTPSQAIIQAKELGAKIDLIITDVIMPEMNGSELVEQMKVLNPRLKHLFMSGYTASVIAKHGILADGVHLIQKPFSKDVFIAKVNEVFEGK